MKTSISELCEINESTFQTIINELEQGKTKGVKIGKNILVEYNLLDVGRNNTAKITIHTENSKKGIEAYLKISPTKINYEQKGNELFKKITKGTNIGIPEVLFAKDGNNYNDKPGTNSSMIENCSKTGFTVSKHVNGEEATKLIELGVPRQKIIKSLDEALISIYSNSLNNQENSIKENKFQKLLYETFLNYDQKIDEQNGLECDKTEILNQNDHNLGNIKRLLELFNPELKEKYKELEPAAKVIDELFNKKDEAGFIYRTTSHWDVRPTGNVLFKYENDNLGVKFIDFEMASEGVVVFDRVRFAEHKSMQKYNSKNDLIEFLNNAYQTYKTDREIKKIEPISFEDFNKDFSTLYNAVDILNNGITALEVMVDINNPKKSKEYQTKAGRAKNNVPWNNYKGELTPSIDLEKNTYQNGLMPSIDVA